jgi:hypothetical protein
MTDDLPGYRPVSRLAVGAVAAGVASSLAVVSPFFWVVPLLGAALAWLGLADVRRPGAEKVGRVAALVGLALSIGFGAQAISAAAAARWMEASRGQTAVRFWLEAIREGRSADAITMCVPEAAAAVERVAAAMHGQNAACRVAARVVGASEHVPRGIAVRATITCPAAADGKRTMTIHVAPETSTQRGQPIEHWMITRCDAE